MNLVNLAGWHQYCEEGNQFLKTAEGGMARRRKVFTPEIVYNLAAMAIEKLIMGYLMYHGRLAENHTMRDLLRAVEEIDDGLSGLRKQLYFIDSFQDICALEVFSRRSPDWQDIAGILATSREVKAYVDRRLGLRTEKTSLLPMAECGGRCSS